MIKEQISKRNEIFINNQSCTIITIIIKFIHPVSRTHVRVSRSPTTFSPCPALPCSRTHTDSRSLSRWLPHARYLASTHLRTLSRLIALSPCTTLPCPHIVSCFASHRLTLPLYLLFGSHTGLESRYVVLVMRCSHTHHRHTIPLSRSH